MQNLNVNYFPPGATLNDVAIVHLPPIRTDTGTWEGGGGGEGVRKWTPSWYRSFWFCAWSGSQKPHSWLVVVQWVLNVDKKNNQIPVSHTLKSAKGLADRFAPIWRIICVFVAVEE